MEIRLMQQEDGVAVGRLEHEIFSDAWSQDSIQKLSDNKQTFVLVVEEGGQIFGYCIFYFSTGEADLVRIAVSSQKRGQGLGEMLLRAALKHCVMLEVEKIFLEVRAGNAVAINLYEKTGFHKIGMRKDYYQNPTEDAVVMALEIDNISRWS